MNMDLSPKFPDQILADVEGCRYYNWTSAEFPMLGKAKVVAGKLVLKPRGLVLPHYGDCNKISYVLEGNCLVGLTLPNKIENKKAIISAKKGDIVPVPLASVSWWYNHGDSDSVILYLGDSSKAYVPGEITYFLLAGPLSYLAVFSNEVIAETYQCNVEKAHKLGNSQKSPVIIKLSQEEANGVAEPLEEVPEKFWTLNIDRASPNVVVDDGGKSTTLTPSEFPSLEEVGINVTRLVLEANATRAPFYASAAQIFYVAKGNGDVEIVGPQGKQLVSNTNVENGQIFVVPKLFMVSISANGEGMELISIATSTRPIIGEVTTKNSVLNTDPSILQASLNITPEFNHLFKQMMETGTTIVFQPKPPYKQA